MLLRWARCRSVCRYVTCSRTQLPVDGGTKRPGAHVAAVGLGTDAVVGAGECGHRRGQLVVSLTVVFFHTSCDSHPAVV